MICQYHQIIILLEKKLRKTQRLRNSNPKNMENEVKIPVVIGPLDFICKITFRLVQDSSEKIIW